MTTSMQEDKQWTYNTHTIDCKLKKIRELLSTTLEHNHMKTSSLKRKDYTLFGFVYASSLIQFN
jgi:hypothetical protein